MMVNHAGGARNVRYLVVASIVCLRIYLIKAFKIRANSAMQIPLKKQVVQAMMGGGGS